MSNLLQFVVSGGVNTAAGFGFKATIVTCDFRPGTRSVDLDPGIYRVAVGGGGGGDSATPGNAAGGTSSWDAGHQATGGAARAAGGVGSGGDVNTAGGSTAGAALALGGGASGHRLGSAPPAGTSVAGGGWSSSANQELGGMAIVDGWGLGIPPAAPMSTVLASTGAGEQPALYGCGGSTNGPIGTSPGPGGGGANSNLSRVHTGGPGGGGAGGNTGTYGASGGGYSEKVITVAAPTTFSYTVGAAGVDGGFFGGTGVVIVEKIG